MPRIRRPRGRTREFVYGRIRASRSPAERLRFQTLVALCKGKKPREIAETLDIGLSTVYRVAHLYAGGGVAALCDQRSRRGARKVTARYVATLIRLVSAPPDIEKCGRSRWTVGLLTRVLGETTRIWLHFTWVWQLLRSSGYRRKRTRPMVRACNPRRRWQWARLVRVLWQVQPGEVVLFGDEADIDHNPKTGFVWCLSGIPAEIETPGRNQKRFLAGALNVDTGHSLYVWDSHKRSGLFIALLRKISGAYRYARSIHLLVDNYSIHDSLATRVALAALGDRIRLHFLPRYSPEYNPVEKIWRNLHETITRNHLFRTLEALMRAVLSYLDRIGRVHLQSPLPFVVTRHGLTLSDAK
jgi:transposase